MAHSKDKTSQNQTTVHAPKLDKMTLVNEASHLLTEGDKKQALVLYERAYDLDKSDEVLAHKIARLLYKMGKKRQAHSHIERFQKTYGGSVNHVERFLADVFAQSGKPHKAAAVLRALIKNGTKEDVEWARKRLRKLSAVEKKSVKDELKKRVKNFDQKILANSLQKTHHRLTLKKVDPKSLYFGQQKASTQDLFGTDYHTLPLTKTPHYKFVTGNKKAYLEYLNLSWKHERPNTNTSSVRNQRADKFQDLLKDIKKNGIHTPLEVCTRFDGKKIIIHGNHRAAIAAHLGNKVSVRELTIQDHLRVITKNPHDRYGTKLKSVPYQSIFYKGKLLLRGRRNDIVERVKLINLKDIKGKTILDIGCNIGVGSLRAVEMGAKKVYGYDVSHRILTAATRINALIAAPCYFAVADFSEKVVTPKCDTGLVFSVDQHVKNNKMLATNIKRNVKSVVYFECHAKADMPAEIRKIFKKIELVGHTMSGTRKFYRCELKESR